LAPRREFGHVASQALQRFGAAGLHARTIRHEVRAAIAAQRILLLGGRLRGERAAAKSKPEADEQRRNADSKRTI
jgi:hypothetical protein